MKLIRLILLGSIGLATVAWAGSYTCLHAGGIQSLGREGVFFQRAANDCGAAALKMILDHFGIAMDYAQLLRRLNTGAVGTAMLSMKDLARAQGLLCEGWRLAPQDLTRIPLPAVLLLRPNHFVVMDRLGPNQGVSVLDPIRGKLRMSVRRLLSDWKGEALLFSKPGESPGPHGRWFVRSQIMERNEPR
jgi:ATP-binding cassette subfamily B protein